MKIYCLGDSLTYGHGLRRAAAWPQLLGERLGCPVDNEGVSGDTTAGMLARFAARDPEGDWTHLILMGGGNDFILEQDASQVLMRLKTIIYQAAQARMRVILGLPVAPERSAPPFALLPTDRHYLLEQGREALRKEMTDFCEAGGLCRVVDFQDFLRGQEEHAYLDALHLNETGNRLVADGLSRLLKR